MNSKMKDTAVLDYYDMIKNSWTWDRMTEKERAGFIDTLCCTQAANAIKGNYDARWRICNLVYAAYLNGLGYTPNWREPEENMDYVPKF